MKFPKSIFSLLLFLSFFSLKAQQYPVDVQVFVTPPYEQSLRDYWASFEPKIQVHLLLRDLNSPMRNVALHFSLENIQGQPLAQTASYALPYQTQLTSGLRKTLSNVDFKSVLALENLHGLTETFYNDLLPEGAYFFCFTAYDATSQTPLSAKARTLVQIRRHTPPLPTLPAKGEVIAKQNQFQHLVFQWMLRDPAPFTQYEFTLKEVWDNSLGPDEAFLSGRLVYQGKVPTNAILYGPDKPILLENKRYVWKVRAFTQNPNNPNQRQSFFHNNGESEAFYFDYVSHCEVPKFLTATTKDNTAHIRWSSGEPPRANNHSGENGGLYKILYREKGKGWKSQLSNHPQATLAGLKRGKNYIYKVGIACGLSQQTQSVFGEQTYLYGTEQEFVTPHKTNDSTAVQCGVKPEIRIKNREPLQEVLGVNETFTAGDFPVTVLSATGSNGVFSGEGYVQVPYLLDTKIKVKFDGIKINTERQLFEGKLVTTYDKTEKNLQFVQEGIGELFGDAGVKNNKINFEIAQIKKDENGRIVVIGKPDEKTGIAPQVVLPVGADYQLTDASGRTWTLDEKGEVTSVGEKADTQLAQNQEKNNLPKGQAKPENFELKWDFSQSAFAFDASGEIPYKALVKGKNDVFQVVIKQKDTLRYSFHFQTDKGLKVDSKKEKEGVFEISRKGLFDFADEELWVVAKNTKTEKEEVIGKCVLVHLTEKEVNVTLIPTAEGLPIDTDAIQKIYAKVGVTLRISTDKVFPVKEKIDTKNTFGDLSTYSPEQQAVIAWYKSERNVKSDTYYVFVGKQEDSQAGYMRLGGQFGFAFLSPALSEREGAKDLARTIAHELGHGIFKLEHPFKKDETKKGTFRTLMDYAQETGFAHSDWKQINDPKLKIYAFQGQSEGENKVFSVKKLLAWLKEHKGNKNAPYNSIDFFVVDQNLFGDRLTYQKEIFRVHKNSFEAYRGNLDLSANGDVVDKTGFYVDFGRNHTHFFLDVYPPRKNKDIPEKAIISLYTESYREFDAMLRFLNFKISEKAKNHIITKYQEQLKKADNDPDVIDVIFETIPDFVILNFSEIELAKSLKSLSQTTISGETTFGTNEEKAILNIVKALGNKNADLLLNTLSKNRKGNKSDSPYLFEVLYQNMDNVGGDDNFTTYIQLLYKYWLKSNYSNKEVQDYIPYNSEKSWGFYSDNVKTSLIYDKIHLQITNKENTYVPDVSYHLYDKVNLLSLNQNTDGLKFPSKEIPAFYLMAVKEVNKGTNIQTGLGLTFDAVTTISGVGNLAKLRYLSGVVKGVKTAIAGIEISSGVLNTMITLSDCESEFCNDLRTYLFWLEMASLGADTFTQQQIRQSANKALKSADNSVSKEIKEELARVGGKVDDAVSKNIIGKYSLANINKETGFIDLLPDLLKKEGLTMDDFHYLMQKNVNALTQTEIQKLTNIRNAIPKPDANTLMQKVIPQTDIDGFINQTSGYYKQIGGSVAVASDTKHLKSFEDYYYGLRLDYKNTKFHLSKNSCGVIRFKSKEIPQNIVIPKGGTFDDWDYPFTATGFTSGKNGRLGIPEWYLKRIEFEDGAEIWEVFNDGREVLRAIYNEQLKKFIKK